MPGRAVCEAHYNACLYAGINISGINGEVMPGQWEYQCGGPGVDPLKASDHLWLSRWLLYRVGEDFGISHLYRMVLKPDNTVRVEIDEEKIYEGSIKEDWEVLKPKQITYPEYVDDDKAYSCAEFGVLGFDVWQVMGGSFSDNLISFSTGVAMVVTMAMDPDPWPWTMIMIGPQFSISCGLISTN